MSAKTARELPSNTRESASGTPISYYCQLAGRRFALPPAISMVATVESPADEDSARLPENRRPEIERHVVYQRGIERRHWDLFRMRPVNWGS